MTALIALGLGSAIEGVVRAVFRNIAVKSNVTPSASHQIMNNIMTNVIICYMMSESETEYDVMSHDMQIALAFPQTILLVAPSVQASTQSPMCSPVAKQANIAKYNMPSISNYMLNYLRPFEL